MSEYKLLGRRADRTTTVKDRAYQVVVDAHARLKKSDVSLSNKEIFTALVHLNQGRFAFKIWAAAIKKLRSELTKKETPI